MQKGKIELTQKDAENTPAGGVVVGKREGQTMIYDDASLGGYFVGRLHRDGGIKMINKSTGQPLEVQGSEVIITAPAVNDPTLKEFEGKMMTNREILSKINSDGGGVSFESGGDIPNEMSYRGSSYNFGGKTMTDYEIMQEISKCGCSHDDDYDYGQEDGKSRGKSLSDIAKMHNVSLAHINQQVDMGLEVEREHTSNFLEQMQIVKDHLVENPNYYTILKTTGLKNGGKIDNLVKDAKNGNNPARDLNNYNDVLDLGTDGMVGGDSGLAFAKGGLVTKENLKNIEKEFLALTDNTNYKGIYDEEEIYYGVVLQWGKYGYSVSEEQQSKDYQMLLNATAKFNNKNIGKLYANAEFSDKFNTVTILDYDMLAKQSELVFRLPEKYFAKLKVGRENNSIVMERIELEIKKSKDLEATSYISKKIGVTEEKAKEIVKSLNIPKQYYEENKNKKKSRFDVFNTNNFPRKDFENLEQTLDYIQSDAFADSVYNSVSYGKRISEGVVHLYDWSVLRIKYNTDGFPFKPDGSTDFYKDRTTTLSIYPYVAVNISGKQDFMTSFKKGISDFIWCYKYYVLGTENKKKVEEIDDLSELLEMVKSGFADGESIDDLLNDVEQVFSNGGGVGLPKVAYLKVKQAGSSLTSIVGNKYNSYAEFADSIKEAYRNIGKKVRSWIYLDAYGVNDELLITVATNISDQKNTNKNYNPFTGSFKNLEKSLSDSMPRSFKKYDWEDWLNSRRISVGAAQTSSNMVDVVRLEFYYDSSLQQRFLRDGKNLLNELREIESFEKKKSNRGEIEVKVFAEVTDMSGKITAKQQTIYVGRTGLSPSMLSLDELKNICGVWFDNKLDFTNFFEKGSTSGTQPLSTPKTLTAKELIDGKIWIGDNPELSKAVEEKLVSLGFPFDELNSTSTFNNNEFIFIYNKDFTRLDGSRESFDESFRKEIFPSDLGIDVNNIGSASSASQSSSMAINVPVKTLTREEIKNSKIFMGTNPKLKEAIQRNLFDKGFSWSSGVTNPQYLDSDIVQALEILDLKFGNLTIGDFVSNPLKEIYPSQLGIDVDAILGGSSATASQSSSMAINVPVKTLTREEIKYTKIWIGDNPELSKSVEEKLVSLGFPFYKDNSTSTFNNYEIIVIDNKYFRRLDWSREAFDNSHRKEIFPSDLGIDVNNLGSASSASQSSSMAINVPVKTLTREEIKNSKIFMGTNPKLKKAIQRNLFDKGFSWLSGDTNPLYLENDYVQALEILDLKFGNLAIGDFVSNPLKEIYPSQLGIDVDAILGGSSATASQSSPTATATTSTPKVLRKEDFQTKKIKIYGNKELALKVISKLEELGLSDNKGLLEKIKENDIFGISTSSGEYVGWIETEESFDENFRKEIFPSDLGIDVNNLGVAPTNKKIDDLAESKLKLFLKIKDFVDSKSLTVYPANIETDNPNVVDFADQESGETFKFSERDGGLYPNDDASSKLLFEFVDFQKEFTSFMKKRLYESLNKYLADERKLYTRDFENLEADLTKDKTDLEDLKKLLPSFQDVKFAKEKAMILKEMKRLHEKITNDGFIFTNQLMANSESLFTPQGMLKYYFDQTTQNPTAKLEDACKLPTPNGKESKLPLSAYFNVRTKQFKNWFGDWEMAYETGNYVNCSKMIDEETKEPKIFFHGVRKYVPNFGNFSNMGQGVVRPYGSFEPPTAFPASYFSDNEDYAKFYGGIAPNMPKPSNDYEPFIYKVFLSAKNPLSLIPLGFEASYQDLLDYLLVVYGIKKLPSANVLNRINNNMTGQHPVWVYVRNDISLLETIKEYGYDALIQIGDIPTFDSNGNVESDRSKFIQEEEYLTFNPSQVKSATVLKSFYFDFFKDIRFNKGGYVRL